MAFTTGDNDYANTRFIVSATAGQGNFTTIQSAINAATGPATIGILPGTYTENLTTKTGVSLCGMPSDGTSYLGTSQGNNVIILGRIDISQSGNCVISNVTLQSNGGGVLLANTSNVQKFTLKNCQVLVSDTSFAVIQNPNMIMDIYNCDVYLQNAVSNFNMNNGVVNCYFCNFISDHAALSTNSTDGILGGTLNYHYCFSSCNVLSFFGGPSNFSAKYSDFEVSGTAGTLFNFTVSGTLSLEFCKIDSGSNSAIDITSNTMTLFNNEITSSNTNAIVGSGGTLIHGGNTFTNSKLITVTTKTGIALITSEGGTNVTSAGTSGNVLTSDGTNWTSAAPATSGTVTSVALSVPSVLSISGSPITSSGTLAIGYSGTALPIANGGTAVTSVTTNPTASSFAGWDANKNLSANSFIDGYRTTVTAAATTTLLVGDAQQQYFTGATTQTVLLPVTSTLVLGQSYTIVNNSSGVVTVQSSGANTIQAMAANTVMTVTVILTSGTSAASWNKEYSSQTVGGINTIAADSGSASGSTVTFSATNVSLTTTFSASGTSVFLNSTDATGNTIYGMGSGRVAASGQFNESFGQNSMKALTTGTKNDGLGYQFCAALTSGSNNCGVGHSAYSLLLTGNFNAGLGDQCGVNYTGSESSNIDINSTGTVAQSNVLTIGSGTGTGDQQVNKTVICGISGKTSATGVPVLINASDVLGTTVSSLRFKDNVKDMGDVSSIIQKFRPVTFTYKPSSSISGIEVSKDESLITQYGLIAEEVAEIFPDMVQFDHKGQPQNVRYLWLIPMLLNEVQNLRKEINAINGIK